MATDPSTTQQTADIEKIRTCSKAIVDYVTKSIDHSYDLKYIFTFSYFKEVLTKIYLSYVYSYYFKKDLKKSLELIDDFEIFRGKLDLSSKIMIKHYSAILKLKGDILFKMEDYIQACNVYLKLLQIYDEINNHSQSRALILFNIALAYLYTKEYALGKDCLTQSLNKYETLNKINPNFYNEKVTLINQLLAKLTISVFS